MFQITAFATLVLILPAHIASIDLTKEYKHSAFVDPLEKYQLHWTVLRNTKQIKFAVQVNITQGWIGFGISQGLSWQMKNADLVIGWVNGGKGYLKSISAHRSRTKDWKKVDPVTAVKARSSTDPVKRHGKLEACRSKVIFQHVKDNTCLVRPGE